MILFFAFLTDSEVKSLEDIIRELPKTEENKRIGRNIGLRKSVLQENISYTSDKGKTYDFNTADKLNALLIKALVSCVSSLMALRMVSELHVRKVG